jgi:tetratricopeptide (TPR) repeat protein
LFWIRRKTTFWILFTVIALLPTSNLLVTSGSIMAERFLYLPGIGLAVLVVMAFSWTFATVDGHRRYLNRVLLPMLFLLAAGRTVLRNRDYRDDLTFWRATVATSPNSFKAHTQLSIEYEKRGMQREALAEADRVREILEPLPDSLNAYEPWLQIWGYYQQAGQTEKAREAANRIAGIFNAAPKCKRGCGN